MFGTPYKLFSVRGIDIKADPSWLVIVVLVGWSFWGRFVVWYDRPTGTAVVMAVIAAVLFFGSVIAHELAHALEARHRGVHVGGITLFLFGGATETRFDVKRPIDEFALTAIGPYTSFVLAAVFGLATVAADGWGLSAVAETLGTLGWLNLALGLFNLLPGAPLDGGRILRSVVWKVTGDRRKAMVVAADAGRVLGAGVMGLGLLQLFLVGAVIGGIWFVFIGWFLMRAAGAERFQAEVTSLLEGRRAEDFVDDLRPVPSDATVGDAVDGWFTRSDAERYPVAHDGRIVGLIDVGAVRGVPRSERTTTLVGSVATSLDEFPRIDHDAPAAEVLEVIPSESVVVLTDGPTVTGIVTPHRVVRAVERLQRIERGGGPRLRRPPLESSTPPGSGEAIGPERRR